jgi:hypothetical protein
MVSDCTNNHDAPGDGCLAWVRTTLARMRGQSPNSYVVYVNYPNNYAKVHTTQCGIYRRRKADRTDYGYWSQSFNTFQRAMAYARSTGKRTVDNCPLCT